MKKSAPIAAPAVTTATMPMKTKQITVKRCAANNVRPDTFSPPATQMQPAAAAALIHPMGGLANMVCTSAIQVKTTVETTSAFCTSRWRSCGSRSALHAFVQTPFIPSVIEYGFPGR